MAQLHSRAKISFCISEPLSCSLFRSPESLKQNSSMKRKIPSGFSTRVGSGRGFHGDRSFGEVENQRQDASFDDTGCRRRVEFSHVHEKDPLDCRDDSSSWKEANSAKKSSGPKTSEYAFFQKFKEGVHHKFQSIPSHVKKRKSENFRSDESPGGSPVGVRIADKHAVSSFLDEDVMPINFNTVSSRGELTPDKPVSSAAQGLSDTFTGEGEDLQQWITNTSSRDVNELYSKRTEYMNKVDMLSPIWNSKPLLLESSIHKDSHKKPPEAYGIGNGPSWDFDSSSSSSSKSAKRICSNSDFLWRVSDEFGFNSSKNGYVPPYASERIFTTMDFPVRDSEETDFMLENLGPTVRKTKLVKGYNTDSFSYRSYFPGSDSSMLLPDRKSMLQWNFDGDKNERHFMTYPKEEPIQDYFGPDDHHQQRNSLCNMNMTGALALRSDCSEEFFNHNSNRFHGHFDEADSVTSMNNQHLSISCSGSYSNFPECRTTEDLDCVEDGRFFEQQKFQSDASSIW